jgi:hypothetical protein
MSASLQINKQSFQALFLIDATASMENWFTALKNAVVQMCYIKELTGLNISIRFIIFRDYPLNGYRCLNTYPFGM